MPVAARRPPRYSPAGIELPRNVDGRSRSARRFVALVVAFEAELGAQLTEADKALIKQAANLCLTSENLQADVVAGVHVDTDALVRISSEARRILELLKATKSAKNKPETPSLQQYLRDTYPVEAVE